MNRTYTILAGVVAVTLALGLLVFGSLVADENRIVVAAVNGETITRGDLYTIIRRMPDNERPIIRNRNDLRRVLESHIDERITEPMGLALEEELSEQQRETFRALARETVFAQNPEQPMRQMYAMEVPPEGQQTPLMREYNLTRQQLLAMKDQIGLKTDDAYLALLGQAALQRAAVESYRAGELTVPEDRIAREYEARKEELRNFEWMSFRAVRFPALIADAQEQAAAMRREVEQGTPFDEVFARYAQQNPEMVIETEIENNPTLDRFRNFWLTASGAEPGEVLGPVYLPEYTQTAITTTGEEISQAQPESYLVLKVLDHRPAQELPLEQARDQLVGPLLAAQKIKDLYAANQVEIFEDKLPDPAAAAQAAEDPFG